MKPHIMAICLVLALTACGEAKGPSVEPPGREESTKTNLLETGAALLQRHAPLGEMDVYLVGFHPMKNDPSHQMEAHHFCRQVNEDFAQCTLFDGNTADANLNGIEYIISERLFEQLPQEERQYWHPHNGEILSGQLIAPNIPAAAENELMKSKMNSYGKTWHTWSTSKGVEIPLGEPMLAWSFNRDGEARPSLIEQRDRVFDINTAEVRRSRSNLRRLAKPQEGVDALKDAFEELTRNIPGVIDKGSAPEAPPGR